MSNIRVLVVDDSVVARSIITRALKNDPEIEVVGSVGNGEDAIKQLPTLKPDIMTLDVEMPDMDGLEVLNAMRRNGLRIPTIMFSSLTESGASTTLKALLGGAQDYVVKPKAKGQDDAVAYIRDELIPRIKQLRKRGDGHKPSATSEKEKSPPLRVASKRQKVAEVIAIGASVGGPAALAQVLPHLAQANVPILIVQHMPPVFTKQLAEQLSKETRVPMSEAQDGDIVAPGRAYIAPGDYHLEVERRGSETVLRLSHAPHENFVRPSADVLFRSVAAAYKSKTLGILLTGAGKDGQSGSEAIRKAGGQLVVQDESTSVVWGMPGAAAKAGLADEILPLDEIGPAVVARTQPASGR